MIDTDPTIIGTIGTVVGVVVGAFGIFRFIAGIKDTLGTRITSEAAGLSIRITSEAEKADTKIGSVSRETRLLVEKLSESEAKSRGELAGTMMNAISDIRRDTKALDEKLTAMRGEMIRRSDLAETRQEIVTALERQDRARAELADKLEKKMESSLLGNRARK
jgi:hypothetical protein